VARGDQFLWGRFLQDAAATEKGATQRAVYLPRGRWFDFWTEQRMDGGREVMRKVDLATLPLFVRAGAIVAFGPIKQYTDEPVEGPLTLVIYPGENGATQIYEDDGISFAHRRGAFTKIAVTWKDAERELTIALAKGSKLQAPATRTIEVRLAGTAGSGDQVKPHETRTITFKGKPVRLKL